MTKREAQMEAHRRWATDDNGPDDRYGYVRLHRKSVPNRYQVGYMTYAGVGYKKGIGDSWEDAFADADLRGDILCDDCKNKSGSP